MSSPVRSLRLTRPLVCFDLETTGEHAAFDRIVQIGVVKLYVDGTVTEWSSLVHPRMPIPRESTSVHHITDEMVRDAPVFPTIAPSIQTGFSGCDILGYNVKNFDLRVLKAEFDRARMLAPTWHSVIDAGRIFQLLERRTLSAAVLRFAPQLSDFETQAHDALVDAKATLQVLLGQLGQHPELPDAPQDLERWTESKGNKGNWIDADGKFAWRNGEAVVNFGNKCLCHPLKNTDRGFLQWMLRGDFSEHAKTIAREALAGLYPTQAPAPQFEAHLCPGLPGAGPCPKCSPAGNGEPV